jgi:hypothetical protein
LKRTEDVTEYEIELAKALAGVSHYPGTSKKRFCKDMAALAERMPERELSERQRYYLELLAWHYRRQLPAIFRPVRQPPPLPKPIKPLKPPKDTHARERASGAPATIMQEDLFSCRSSSAPSSA